MPSCIIFRHLCRVPAESASMALRLPRLMKSARMIRFPGRISMHTHPALSMSSGSKRSGISGGGRRGKKHIVQIMVIAPLRYRLSKKGPLLYRQPAYLICTDPDLPPEKILQAYLWRWDIEINFRDEKTLLGTGQAEVRNPISVKAVPQMMVASYSLLLLAGIHNWGIKGIPQPQNIPKWQNPNKKYRASTNDLIKQLRHELWADSISSINLSHFDRRLADKRSPLNPILPAFDAILQVNSA